MTPLTTSLKGFLDRVEARLDLTEPAATADGFCVAALAPAAGGLVGLDVDTGRCGSARATRPSPRSR
jgi:hypothetical protein